MEPPAKGTVTPIASLFSAEEARKAVSYVEEKIGEKREEMNRLQQFVDENDNLISLVKKLPDQLQHNVMVPFGKLAFFPGRLIHTNECLVLLGENYYTDRSSKQTVEILRRRDKTLQSQIHSLKTEIEDFQAEASFFSSTASEVAEGLVEIREEYEEEEEEEDSSATVVQSGEREPSGLTGGETAEGEVEDDEFARIMSRLNELEMEEEQEGEEHDSPKAIMEESEHDMVKGVRGETEQKKIMGQEPNVAIPKKVSDHSFSVADPRFSEPRVRKKVFEMLPEKHPHEDLDDSKPQYLHKEDQLRGGTPQQNTGSWRDFQTTSAVSRANAKPNIAVPQKIEPPIQKPEPEFDSSKAFTGLIVERTENLEINPRDQVQSSGSKPSKPVSRFKAQRK